MFSNNTKISSFYPTNKRPNTHNNNSFTNNKNNLSNNNINNLFINNQFLNYQNDSISSSVELALITVNLSYPRLKLMSVEELDNYVKTMAYNNSYDSKKYLLALNILTEEIEKKQNNVIKQQLPNNQNKNNKDLQNNKINMNEVLYIEPEEFNLNTNFNSNNNDYLTNHTNQSKSNSVFFLNDTNTSENNYKLFARQNKNLDMSTYSGNPLGTFKITNNEPFNSVRPINQFHKNDSKYLYNQLNNDNDIIANNDNNNNFNSQFTFKNNYSSNINNNNIIQQTSTLSNPQMFMTNGKNRRTSNLDVGSSNNYVIIK